jgi:hypothetical protein
VAVGSATITASHATWGLSATAVLTVTAPAAVSYWTSKEVLLDAVSTDAFVLDVPIPDPSAAIGMALQGTNSNAKVIDHGVFLIDQFNNPLFIRDPTGAPAPLSFNFTDFNGDTFNDLENTSLLFDFGITALFFPNDGTVGALPAGSYEFPIASFNFAGTDMEADLLQPYVFYKTATPQQTPLRLNVFVVSGVGGIATLAQAQADAEIQGALAILQQIYGADTDVALNVAIDLRFIADSSFAIINSFAEWDTLNAGFPDPPTHDAMNIFIVADISLGVPGILGIAARIPGPFNRQGTIRSGTLAAYQGDGVGTLLGETLAHEFGHFLGLYHTSQTNGNLDGIVGFDPISDTPLCATSDITGGGLGACPDVTNLMFPIATGVPQRDLTAEQGVVIRLNPAVTLP